MRGIALLLLVGCAVSPETNERRLAVEAEIDAILSQPLQPAEAFADLVYALETLVETGIAEEREILPLFHRLWSLRGQQDAAALDQMRAIQTELRVQFAHRTGGPKKDRQSYNPSW